MSKEELLITEFDSAVDAMNALSDFLQEVDNSYHDENRSDYQNLHVVGNRIFD